MTRFVPIPDPARSRDPPRRPPLTSLSVGTPDPDPGAERRVGDALQAFLRALRPPPRPAPLPGRHPIPVWRHWLTATLDLADAIAAPIARSLGGG
jgi:hypothetical protein